MISQNAVGSKSTAIYDLGVVVPRSFDASRECKPRQLIDSQFHDALGHDTVARCNRMRDDVVAFDFCVDSKRIVSGVDLPLLTHLDLKDGQRACISAPVYHPAIIALATDHKLLDALQLDQRHCQSKLA